MKIQRNVKISLNCGICNVNYSEKQDYNFHKGSCISYQREEQNDLYNEYGNGYSYDENNTIIQQLWYDIEDPIFDGWEDQLNMDIKTVSTKGFRKHTIRRKNIPGQTGSAEGLKSVF